MRRFPMRGLLREARCVQVVSWSSVLRSQSFDTEGINGGLEIIKNGNVGLEGEEGVVFDELLEKVHTYLLRTALGAFWDGV